MWFESWSRLGVLVTLVSLSVIPDRADGSALQDVSGVSALDGKGPA